MSQAPYQVYAQSQGSPQGYPPQQGPPPAMYQPQQQGYPPQQQGYPPQQQGYPPQQQGYPPQQQQGYPPPQQQPYPPQQGYPPQQPPMGSPHQPTQQQLPAALNVNYLAEGCCTECGGQPTEQDGLTVMADGKEIGRLEQGQKKSFFIASGVSVSISVEVSAAKIMGNFLRSLRQKTGHIAMVPAPGQQINLTLGWESNGCCSSKYHPFVRKE